MFSGELSARIVVGWKECADGVWDADFHMLVKRRRKAALELKINVGPMREFIVLCFVSCLLCRINSTS